MILNGFDTDINFWKANPQLKIPQPFADILSTDKSKTKSKSSQIMWAIALLVDPESKFSNISLKNRKKMIGEDFLKEKEFKWEEVQSACQYYEEMLNITLLANSTCYSGENKSSGVLRVIGLEAYGCLGPYISM